MASGGRPISASSATASALERVPPQPAIVTTIETTSGLVSTAPSRSWSLWLSTCGCKPIALASCCWVRPTARSRSRSASRNATRSRIVHHSPRPGWRRQKADAVARRNFAATLPQRYCA